MSAVQGGGMQSRVVGTVKFQKSICSAEKVYWHVLFSRHKRKSCYCLKAGVMQRDDWQKEERGLKSCLFPAGVLW